MKQDDRLSKKRFFPNYHRDQDNLNVKQKLSSQEEHGTLLSGEQISKFDQFKQDIEVILGKDHLTADKLHSLASNSNYNVEAAIHLYFEPEDANKSSTALAKPSTQKSSDVKKDKPIASSNVSTQVSSFKRSKPQNPSLFIGSFGVEGYIINTNCKLDVDEAVKFKSQTQKNQAIVRFTTVKGVEIGKLPKNIALTIASLNETGRFTFEGSIIFVPTPLKMGTTILLQIRCFLQKNLRNLQNLPENLAINYRMAAFDIIKRLELEQVRGTKLDGFEKFNINDSIRDLADTSGEAELENEQVNDIYANFQNECPYFPEREPADSFNLELRTYQKQALHWLMAQESQQETKSDEFHPMWASFRLPSANNDCHELYMNLLSGELSLDKPSANTSFRGGILADEMGLGKTIEILSLIHTLKQNSQYDTSSSSRFCKSTLVIAPMSLIGQWHQEAIRSQKSKSSLNILFYYGNDIPSDLSMLCHGMNAQPPDLIITSYGRVLSEYSATQSRPSSQPTGLFGVRFFRIVLDEAHNIRNRKCLTAKACFKLKGERHWLLTGTPIINKLDDLYSLFKFLDYEPWSHYDFWRAMITTPFESKEYQKALQNLQMILKSVTLRRTKEMTDASGNPIVQLPDKTIQDIYLDFSQEERKLYTAIYQRAVSVYSSSTAQGTVLRNLGRIFLWLLRLRQMCCHPFLIKNKLTYADLDLQDINGSNSFNADDKPEDTVDDIFDPAFNIEDDTNSVKLSEETLKKARKLAEDEDAECSICLEVMNQSLITPCWHKFCKNCLLKYITHGKKTETKCPACCKNFKYTDLIEVLPTNSKVQIRKYRRHQSTKIEALISHLDGIYTSEADAKVVVFTQFSSFMDIIIKNLEGDDREIIRFDGSMSQQQRIQALETFEKTTNPCIMVVSLKTGGVGLNLTAASYVFILDLWWSYSIEAQAIDRIHRLGQTKTVSVVRFIVRNTVEEKMLKIQDRKKAIANFVGIRKGEKQKETLENINTLFEE